MPAHRKSFRPRAHMRTCTTTKCITREGALQPLANKLDISVSSSTPDLPQSQFVVDEFNRRMTASVFSSDTKERYSSASYHITNVEYKESMAIPLPSYQIPSGTALTAQAQQQLTNSIFCSSCGTKLAENPSSAIAVENQRACQPSDRNNGHDRNYLISHLSINRTTCFSRGELLGNPAELPWTVPKLSFASVLPQSIQPSAASR